jgi:hypothetical protein
MLKRNFINGNQLIIEMWNNHQCLRNLHEREKRKKPTGIATNQIPSPMLSIGHGYHGCFVGIRKAEEELNDGDYFNKILIFERKCSLKPPTNGYGFDKLHLQR